MTTTAVLVQMFPTLRRVVWGLAQWEQFEHTTARDLILRVNVRDVSIVI